jgi:hypothetical protein
MPVAAMVGFSVKSQPYFQFLRETFGLFLIIYNITCYLANGLSAYTFIDNLL